MEKKNVFAIPEHRMEELKAMVAKLDKKAQKVGAAHITYNVEGEHVQEFKEHPLTGKLLAFPLVIRFFDVSFSGIEPKFDGWQFIARIDHEVNNVNIINALPEIELDERYRTLGNVCEHCNINRYRKASYVVRHESGEEKQVGSSCVRDFLGHGAPEQIGAFCEGLFKFVREVREDDFLYGGRFENRFFVSSLLVITCAVIRVFGWVSSKVAQEKQCQPTSFYVSQYYREDKETVKAIGELTDEDRGIAEKALEWIKGKAREELKGDYMYNLKALCEMETIQDKHISFVVSLIATYRREYERFLLAQAEKKEPSSWIGHPDLGRMKLQNVKVIGVSSFEGMYGTTYLYRFLANGKDKLTWFASKDQGLEQDQLVNIAFSVKKLDEYKGEHITIIQRAKLV
jgi:hypothetical protein